MTLGAMIAEQISALGEKQQSAAAEWQTIWNKKAEKALVLDTVESRLSELRGDKLSGVKFFFSDVARSDVLQRVLKVDKATWTKVVLLAQARLDKDRQPTVVVDMASLPLPPAARVVAFADLLDWVANRPAWKNQAVTIVLTAEQHENFPRGFDKLSPRVATIVATNADDAARKLRQEADACVLVASAQPQVWSAWLEVYADEGGHLHLEPENGLEAFASDGSVGVPPSVAIKLASLTTLGPTASGVFDKLPRPWRMVAAQVASGSTPPAGTPVSKLSIPDRLGLAAAVGLDAAAWPRECIEHEISVLVAALGATPKPANQAKLEALLTRAATHPTKATLLRVDDRIHAINWDTSKLSQIQAGARLQVHVVEAPVPALTRLQQAFAAVTADDIADDPFLDQVIEKLATSPADQKALAYARACLWTHGRLQVPTSKANPTLGQTLAAAMRATPIPLVEAALPDGCLPAHFAKSLQSSKLPQIANLTSLTASRLRPNVVRAAVLRASDIKWCEASAINNADEWLESLSSMDGVRAPLQPFVFTLRNSWGDSEPTKVETLPDELWADLQDHADAAWLAIRRGLEASTQHNRADGAVLFDVGNGLVARLIIRQAVTTCLPFVSLPVREGQDRRGRSALVVDTIPVALSRAESDRFMAVEKVDVPKSVELACGGVRATITFGYSPYSMGSGQSCLATGIAVAVNDQRDRDDDD